MDDHVIGHSFGFFILFQCFFHGRHESMTSSPGQPQENDIRPREKPVDRFIVAFKG